MNPTLRPARPADAQALATLSTQLGYPVAPATLAARLDTLLAAPEQHVVQVVEVEGRVCGWIHGFVRPLLESATCVEVGGLVVAEDCRGQGLGAQLLAACEAWAAARGIAEVNVRCAEHRSDAHRFYRREGYSHIKNQLTFRKTVAKTP
ncbi:GNAT family N-acetyltransferase [Vogesella sp. LIG4]|uniref:GNAT family N-acetyltransferase n=1 Tax=Vogesella sp. LIG4 TaxID=1192162 RepID=UPI0008200BF1|nr:GNAT family N-acetyltransferase [Vogesella sp. LIG4]SCK11917.1 N-acetylglutamate synthase and related acetyltransferases [Vogesella sp. LIG4]